MKDYNPPHDVKCKCPTCGKIFTVKKMRVFDYNPDKLFRKYCKLCDDNSKRYSFTEVDECSTYIRKGRKDD